MAKVESLYIELCVFKYEKGRPRYLVLHRSETEKIYPGIFQFITGAIDTKSDGEPETAIEAAKREMIEEINLKPKNFWFVPYVNPFYVHTKDVVNISPVFLAEVENDETIILSDEHQSFEWMDYDGAIKKLSWPSQRKSLEIINSYLTGVDDWGKYTNI